MKKLLLWLQMYNISIVEYFNKLKNNSVTLKNNKNKDIAELYDLVENGAGLVRPIVNINTDFFLRTGEVARTTYTTSPDDADPRLYVRNPNEDLIVEKIGTTLTIYSFTQGEYTFELVNVDDEVIVELSVQIVESNS